MTEEEKKRERHLGKVEVAFRMILKANNHSSISFITMDEIIEYTNLEKEEVEDILFICEILTKDCIILELRKEHSNDLFENRDKNFSIPLDRCCTLFVFVAALKGFDYAIEKIINTSMLSDTDISNSKDFELFQKMLFTFTKLFANNLKKALTYNYPYDLLAELFWFDLISEKQFRQMCSELETELKTRYPKTLEKTRNGELNY